MCAIFGSFDKDKFEAIFQGYEKFRILSHKELENLPILLRGASIRILLTRLHDQLYHPEEAFVKPKNPMEYFDILEYHQNNPTLAK